MTVKVKQKLAKINLKVAEKFLSRLAPQEDKFTFQTFDDSGDRKRRGLVHILHGTLAEHAGQLKYLNKKGACISVTINQTDLRGRAKKNILAVRAAFVDLDGADIEPVKTCEVGPHIIVESSPGRFHAYWLTKGLSLDQFASVQLGLAQRFGGDQQVQDLPHCMRLPGFLNQKREMPFRVKIIKSFKKKKPVTTTTMLQVFPYVKTKKKKAKVLAFGGDIIEEGRRNATLFMLGVDMVNKELSAIAILAALMSENSVKCLPPLVDDEVKSIAESCESYRDKKVRRDVIDKLALLSPLDYDLVREEMAEQFGVKLGALDKEVASRRSKKIEQKPKAYAVPVEPWPDRVNGRELLDDLTKTFKRHVILPIGGARTLALWTLYSHAYDLFDINPLLAVGSPQMKCGKSTLKDILLGLIPRPMDSSNISMASTHRLADKFHCTFMLDEAHSYLGKNEMTRNVLKSGHRRGGSFVTHMERVGDDWESVDYSTWCPKAIFLAGQVGKFDPMLSDRCIHIWLKRRLSSEKIKRFPRNKYRWEELCRKCDRWVRDHAEAIQQARPKMPKGLDDRVRDNWRVLVILADTAGGKWPKRTRQLIRRLKPDDDDTAAVMLISDVNKMFKETGYERLSSYEIQKELELMQDRPWPEFSNGKPITMRGIAKILQPFGIEPKKLWIDKSTMQGYERKQFRDAYIRYVRRVSTPRTPDTKAHKGFKGKSSPGISKSWGVENA